MIEVNPKGTEKVVQLPIGTLIPFRGSDGSSLKFRVHHADRGRVILVPWPEGAFVIEPVKEPWS